MDYSVLKFPKTKLISRVMESYSLNSKYKIVPSRGLLDIIRSPPL